MTLDQGIALAAAILPTVVALITWRAVRQVHIDVNSRLTALLEQTAAASKAAGIVLGRAEGLATGLEQRPKTDPP